MRRKKEIKQTESTLSQLLDTMSEINNTFWMAIAMVTTQPTVIETTEVTNEIVYDESLFADVDHDHGDIDHEHYLDDVLNVDEIDSYHSHDGF